MNSTERKKLERAFDCLGGLENIGTTEELAEEARQILEAVHGEFLILDLNLDDLEARY